MNLTTRESIIFYIKNIIFYRINKRNPNGSCGMIKEDKKHKMISRNIDMVYLGVVHSNSYWSNDLQITLKRMNPNPLPAPVLLSLTIRTSSTSPQSTKTFLKGSSSISA